MTYKSEAGGLSRQIAANWWASPLVRYRTIWPRSTIGSAHDCLSWGCGIVPHRGRHRGKRGYNIDVPVEIRPRYLVYVSPWDIKIAEETTDISRQGCWYPTQPRVLLAEAFSGLRKLFCYWLQYGRKREEGKSGWLWPKAESSSSRSCDWYRCVVKSTSHCKRAVKHASIKTRCQKWLAG